jgi:hypothetical protein
MHIKFWSGNPQGKRPLEKWTQPKRVLRKWFVNCNHLAQDRGQRWVPVSLIMLVYRFSEHVVKMFHRKTPLWEPQIYHIPYTLSIFWSKRLCLPYYVLGPGSICIFR